MLIKENDKVLFGDLVGVVQAIYGNQIYVYFFDGLIRQFDLDGSLNEKSIKNNKKNNNL